MVIASEYTTRFLRRSPRVSAEERELPPRGMRGRGRGRGGSGGTAKEEENGNLLGSECNFIVNLSLSEGKQWPDLRTVRPRSAPAILDTTSRSSLPSPLVVFCSSSPLPGKLEGNRAELRGIAASHLSLYRSESPQSLPICKRVGHHRRPAVPLPSPVPLPSTPLFSPPFSVYIDVTSGETHTQISRMPTTFLSVPYFRGALPSSMSLRLQPPSRMNHALPRDIPITNSTLTPLRRVSWFWEHTYYPPRECICDVIPLYDSLTANTCKDRFENFKTINMFDDIKHYLFHVFGFIV